MDVEAPRTDNVCAAILSEPKCWQQYFPGEKFSVQDRKCVLIADLLQAFRTRIGHETLSKIAPNGAGGYALEVDANQLQMVCTSAELGMALDIAPTEAISCLGAAAYEAFRSISRSSPLSWSAHCGIQALCEGFPVDHGASAGRVDVKIVNYIQSRITFRRLKASCLDKLVTITGVVVRASVVKPLLNELESICTTCATRVQQVCEDGKYVPPKKCPQEGCRSRTFVPDKREAMKVDFQRLRLQERPGASEQHEGRVPRTVDCELRGDLVDSCLPGDIVTVCGFVKFINRDTDIGGGGKSKSNVFNLYIDTHSVVNAKHRSKGKKTSSTAASVDQEEFSPDDLRGLVTHVELYGPDLFKQIVHSICPAIFGYEFVKAGIALSLFGGSQKFIADGNRVPVRGDIHVLVVGDPGMGKSQLLKAASAVAPRGVYVCGSSTTSAGLTVSIVKDSVSGDFSFEAGAMVLADKGTCCIDEFDKMTAEHQALLEAMEQQCVSVAKAGMLANLSARASVVAAANPINGHYNRNKTVTENLKMSAALLSRFDLVFILLDHPDEAKDKRLTDHVMALHSGGKNKPFQAKRRGSKSSEAVSGRSALHQKLCQELEFEPLEVGLLRKYIAYARQYVFPRLTPEASSVLQKFYLQLRDHSRVADGTPVTARQLESLIRLAESRAKMELREEVTAQDAQDVVDLMKEALFEKLPDGNADSADMPRTRIGGRGVASSKSKQIKQFITSLAELAEAENKPSFTRKELAELADSMNLKVPNLDDTIDQMNEAGLLLKKSDGKYEVQP